jgi:uncharacterized membrane protein
MSKFLKIASIATLVAVVGAVIVAAVALAQGPPEPPFPFGGKWGDHRPFGPGPLGPGPEEGKAYGEQMHQALADALGMTVDELKAAMADGQTPCDIIEAKGLDATEVWQAVESARQDMLQQAVDDGLLTQQQADRISERMADFDANEWYAEGGGPGFFGRMQGPPFFGPQGPGSEEAQAHQEQMHQALADALGMTVDELKAAMADGQTPCDIIEAKGLDATEVQEALESARQDMLQQLVEDGLLTQQQADRISERMADHNPGLWCSEGGPAQGMRKMRDFHGFSGWPNNQ